MYKREFERVTPESVGISSRKLKEMLIRLENCGTEMHGFMLERHGKIAAECWWAPYHKDMVHICHSFGKSYVATAIGLACTQGILTPDDKIVDLFRAEIAEYGVEITSNLSRLTVAHVLTMSGGMSVHAPSGEHLLRNYLTTQVDKEPGSVFMYNTTGSCMLGAIICKITGKSVREYLTRDVFEKIGLEVDKLGWLTFKNGIHAAPGVSSTTENNLRLGMLYLQNGAWEGKQLIDPEWMKKATTKRIDTKTPGFQQHPDAESGYGYQLWMCSAPDTFRFSGGHGQDAIMSRKNDLVISVNQAASMPHDQDCSMDILNEYLLYPDLEDALPEDPEGYAQLHAYLASRRLPDWESRSVPVGIENWEGIYHVTEGKFHINPELRPMQDENVYRDFYDVQDEFVKTLSIIRENEGFEVCFDGMTTLNVRLDGKLIPTFSRSAIPTYYLACSTAFFDGDTMIIDTRFIQTCFQTRIWLTKTDEGVDVKVRKEKLHDKDPYFFYQARLIRH